MIETNRRCGRCADSAAAHVAYTDKVLTLTDEPNVGEGLQRRHDDFCAVHLAQVRAYNRDVQESAPGTCNAGCPDETHTEEGPNK